MDFINSNVEKRGWRFYTLIIQHNYNISFIDANKQWHVSLLNWKKRTKIEWYWTGIGIILKIVHEIFQSIYTYIIIDLHIGRARWHNLFFILMIPNIIKIYRNERKHMMMHVILFINRNIKQCLPSIIKSSKSHHTSIIKPTFIHYQRKWNENIISYF